MSYLGLVLKLVLEQGSNRQNFCVTTPVSLAMIGFIFYRSFVMKKLSHYLGQIVQGEAINFSAFLKELEKYAKDDFIDRNTIFQPTKVAPAKHIVEVIDKERFYQLLLRAEQAPSDRVEAAKSGDSHQVATSFSHLLVFHSDLPDSRPDVVVIENDSLRQNFKPKGQLLIIENEENFFRFQAILPLLSEFAGKPLDLSNTDVVYGAGKQINKGLNFSFFEQYNGVFCAFDWDLGGLQMYQSLANKLTVDVEFLQPKSFAGFQSKFCYRPKSNQQWLTALALAQSLGFDGLLQTFKSTLRFLEQEVWLCQLDDRG